MESAGSAAHPFLEYGAKIMNGDVVQKFSFRYLNVPAPNGLCNKLINNTNKNISMTLSS